MIPNVAIIGLGRIGLTQEFDEKRTHPCTHVGVWATLQNSGRANIVAVVDKDMDRRNDFSAYALKTNHNLCNIPVCFNIAELEAIEKTIDIAVVATPTYEHYQNVIQLCKYSSPKVIFMEKPIAERLSDAHYMMMLCHKNGVLLGVNHTRRWDTIYNSEAIHGFLKRINPQHITFNYPGPIMRDGTHAFDLLRMWFGSPIAIHAFEYNAENWITKKNPEFTDFNYSGYIEFNSEDGHPLLAYYNGALNTDYLLFEVDVIGQNGRLTIKDNGTIIQMSDAHESKRYTNLKELVTIDFAHPSEHNPLLLAAENILDACTSPSYCPIELKCTGSDGYEALEIAIAFQKSWRESNTVFLPITSDDGYYTKRIHSW